VFLSLPAKKRNTPIYIKNKHLRKIKSTIGMDERQQLDTPVMFQPDESIRRLSDITYE
jgi:hypothetical protein